MAVNQHRLARATLNRLPATARPLVTPGEVRPGIVHLGIGAFHRAHQAVYTEAALAAAGGDWGIVAVAPRRRQLVDVLAAQDALFSVATLDQGTTHVQVVGSLAGVRHAPSDPAEVVALLADPAIRVVTLTVTEKAYLLDPATGRLTPQPRLRAEVTGQAPPASVPGLLVAGLRARAAADAGPIALVSCDNLPHNGRRLRGAVTDAIALAGGDADRLADWAAASVSYPGTMVDRIVPATTPQTLATAQSTLGVVDLAAVAAEPYRQWVIEDEFPAGRPAWETAGATLTDDAGPYERLKLRTLNGVHSALAYLGALAGCETIDAALAVPGMRSAMERFIAEDVAASLQPPAGVSVVDYGASVLERFANPAIGHRTLQVASEGSQKLPQRVLDTLADRRAAGASPRWAALVVAAWLRFIAGSADDGRPLPLVDPLADDLRAALAAGGDDSAATVDGLFGVEAVFASDLAADDEVRSLVTEWYTALRRHGVADTLAGAQAAQ